MTRIELAKKLKVSTESMKKFIRDFDLDLNDCLFPNMNVKEKFEKFATENEEFLQKYEQYLHQSKSVEDIAENLKKPLQEVKDVVKKSLPNLFENGRFKSSVSTFGVDTDWAEIISLFTITSVIKAI